ncbi:MAG: hypothetical protein HYW33_04055 [Candidatus Blackburnbacteria bacterium]|nr:hypothetical protein [Candidatus Blackburnbacteria bacterium]
MDREKLIMRWEDMAAQCNLIADLLRVPNSEQTLNSPGSQELWDALLRSMTFLINATRKSIEEKNKKEKT